MWREGFLTDHLFNTFTTFVTPLVSFLENFANVLSEWSLAELTSNSGNKSLNDTLDLSTILHFFFNKSKIVNMFLMKYENLWKLIEFGI